EQRCRRRRDARAAPAEGPRQLPQQNDVQHVEEDARQVIAERPRTPDRPVDRIRQVDDRPRDVVQYDRAQIGDARDRRVQDDGVVVVVDERIAQRIQVDDAGGHRQDAADHESIRGFQDRYTTNIGRNDAFLMRPLRILHVTPYCPDAWAYGGIPRLVGSLTRGLARRGHAVTVCTTDACDESARLPASSRGVRDRVNVRVFPNLSNWLAYHLQLFLPLGLHTYLQREAGGFDVAHLHACRNVPGAMATYHLGRAGVPYVLAPNGTAPLIERRQTAKR